MALKPLNSVGGFSVGEIPTTIILANGDITTVNGTFTGNLITYNFQANNLANLGQVANVRILGGSSGQYLQTDGSGNLTWTTANTSQIFNGTSNVAIPVSGGNVNTSVGGVANVLVVTTTGANVAGTLNATGNLTVLNANLGNLATANFVNVATNVNVTGTMEAGNVRTNNLLYANGNPWDLQEAAGANTYVQYNDGSNNFGASAAFTFDYAGNVLKVDGNANITGTTKTYQEQLTSLLSQQVVYGNGSSFLVGNANFTFNDASSTLTVTGNANVTNTLNGNVGNFSGNINSLNANLGNLVTANFVNVSSNLNVTDTANVGNLRTNNLLYANGQPWDLQEAAGSNTQVQFNDGNNNFGASSNFTFNTATNTLTVTGNANVTNTLLTPNINSGTGNLTLTSNSFNTVYDNTGNVTFPTGGTVTVGTLVGNVNANVTITAANTSILFSDAGVISGATGFTFDKTSNITSLPGELDVAGFANITGNATINTVSIASGNISGGANNIQVYSQGWVTINHLDSAFVYVNSGGAYLETLGGSAQLDYNGDFSLPNNLSVFGDIANANNVSITNELAGNTANFSGNIIAGNISTSGSGGNITGANVISANTFVGNLTATTANISSNLVVSNLTVNLELAGNTANFTGNVTLSGPNVTVNNYLSGNVANFSGNIYSNNANLGNLVDANVIRTGELYNGTSNIRIASNGNVTVSSNAVGNVVTFSDVGVNVVGYVTANGNGTFGALYSNTLTAQGGNLSLYSEQAGDSYIQLRPYGNGTVDVGNVRITSLATPNAQSDAATKQYVDDVAQGLNVHDSCYAATANTLANLTGGIITYNNGTAGVGATLTLSGSPTKNFTSANCFDGNVTAVATNRILVKNETNAAYNGIYVVTSSTVLTRADDYNTVPEVEAGDFVFVQDGDTYNDTGWVQTSVVVTIGTDPINFTQFSGAGTYQAGAGLTLTGTVFSVNVDNVTTEISGGNVIVKANAQLTTPNIGAATGTSVDLTGNVLAANVNANTKVTTTDLEATGNILANNISANSNLTVSNATVNLSLTGNTANFSGNVVVPNLTVNLALVGNTANFSGNITSLNANLGNLATANYVNIAANLQTVNANVTGTLTVANANIASNLTVNNLTVNLELAGNTANFSGNVIVPNLTVNLQLAGNTANFTGNISAANANLGNLAQANYFTGTLINGTSNAGIDGTNGNFNISVSGNANVLQLTNSNANFSGNVNVIGNISANNFTSNVVAANNKVNIGTSQIVYGNVTTSSITANQTIATISISGVTGVEWMVKGYDSSGSKYSMALVTAVTDGGNADYSTFGTVGIGGSTGTLAVNVVGSNLELQVTPSSSNSTVWVTQFRTI